MRAYRRNSIPQKLPLPSDPPPPYTPSEEHLNDLSAGTLQNGSNGPHNTSYNLNNSSHAEPSAPRVSSTSVNIGEGSLPSREPGSSQHYNSGSHTHPASHVHHPNSLPHSPPSNMYPNLPRDPPAYTDPGIVPRTHPYHVPNSPSLPEESQPPSSPVSPHSTSAPNLAEDSHTDHSLRYPPLNVHDNSSFNDSSFHPDISSSSPNLACNRKPSTSTPDSSPPFNPYYDWLPSNSNENKDNKAADKQNKVNNTVSQERADGQCVPVGDPSVRPRVSRNPFLENYSDDETDEESLSGAMRKSSLR